MFRIDTDCRTAIVVFDLNGCALTVKDIVSVFTINTYRTTGRIMDYFYYAGCLIFFINRVLNVIRAAKDFDCAIVLVDHMNKNQLADALYRNNGSIDKVGAARSVLTIIKDKDDKSKKYLVQTKANLAPMGHGIVLSVGEDGVEFLEEIEADADEIMSRYAASDLGRPDGRLHEAMDFIGEMLADGRLPARECEARLREAGIRSGTAKKAKKRLGVVSTKPCIEWYWSLPE